MQYHLIVKVLSKQRDAVPHLIVKVLAENICFELAQTQQHFQTIVQLADAHTPQCPAFT